MASRRLAREEITTLLVEGGAEVHASFVGAPRPYRFEFVGPPERVGDDFVLRLRRRDE